MVVKDRDAFGPDGFGAMCCWCGWPNGCAVSLQIGTSDHSHLWFFSASTALLLVAIPAQTAQGGFIRDFFQQEPVEFGTLKPETFILWPHILPPEKDFWLTLNLQIYYNVSDDSNPTVRFPLECHDDSENIWIVRDLGMPLVGNCIVVSVPSVFAQPDSHARVAWDECPRG